MDQVFLDVIKDLLVEFMKWAAIGAATLFAARLPVIQASLKRISVGKGTVSWTAIAIALAGFLSSASSIAYTRYELGQLGDWGASPDQPKVENINGGYGPIEAVCPKGSYVVGVRNFGNRAPPYCIGCFIGVQVICRKLLQ